MGVNETRVPSEISGDEEAGKDRSGTKGYEKDKDKVSDNYDKGGIRAKDVILELIT